CTVASVTDMGPPSSPSKLEGVYGLGMPPGLGIGQGAVPSMTSLGEWPCSRAAIKVKALNDEPGWRAPSVTMSYCAWSNPAPPTRARTAPLLGSIDTRAAVNLP